MATRFRIALEGDRFRWKSGSKPQLYGLNCLEMRARDAGQVVLVEGELDVHRFRHHGIPALGIPGATNWREDRDAPHFDGIDKIFIVIEPDRGGEAMRKWIAQSAIRHRAVLVTLPLNMCFSAHIWRARPNSSNDCRSPALARCHGLRMSRPPAPKSAPRPGNESADLAQSELILERLDQRADEVRCRRREAGRKADLPCRDLAPTRPSGFSCCQGSEFRRKVVSWSNPF